MRLSDSNKVDYLGLGKGGDRVIVTLVDDCDWSDETRHIALLQTKINRYFQFIESGEVYEQLKETTGRSVPDTTPVTLSVLAKYEPAGGGPRFIQQVSEVAQDAGIDFSFKVLAT